MAIVVAFGLVSCSPQVNGTSTSNAVPVDWYVDGSVSVIQGSFMQIFGKLSYSNGDSCQLPALCNCTSSDIVIAEGGWDVIGVSPGQVSIDAIIRYHKDNVSEPFFESSGKVSVTVLPEERVMTGLKITPSSSLLNEGDEIILKVEAVYDDGTTKIVHPRLCNWEFEDDGKQHITFDMKKGLLRACQGKGDTFVRVSYTENGISQSADAIVKVS